jgi:hypothetical protein
MIDFIIKNWQGIAEGIAAIVGIASVIVKLTPTLKDDNILLPIVKFIGKFIALNKTVDDADRPK